MFVREKQRGVENSGEGKHTIKPLPKNGFGPPPPMIRFPPPLCSRHVIFFGGNGHTQDKSQFLRPPRVALEGALYSTFSPPPKSHDTFCPPICDSQLLDFTQFCANLCLFFCRPFCQKNRAERHKKSCQKGIKIRQNAAFCTDVQYPRYPSPPQRTLPDKKCYGA